MFLRYTLFEERLESVQRFAYKNLSKSLQICSKNNPKLLKNNTNRKVEQDVEKRVEKSSPEGPKEADFSSTFPIFSDLLRSFETWEAKNGKRDCSKEWVSKS